MELKIDLGVKDLIQTLERLIMAAKEKMFPDGKVALSTYYEPIFKELQRIHAGYASLFTGLIEATPLRDFGELRQDFADQRKDPDWWRAQFRAKARALLDGADRQDARRFLASVLTYFVEDHTPTRDIHVQLDDLISRILQGGASTYEGPDLAINSPSFRLSNKIKEAVDSDDLREAASQAWCDLGLRIALVTQMYYELEQNILLSRNPG